MPLRIETNDHSVKDGKIHAAIGLTGGFAAKHYWTDKEEPFVGNFAFFNVLFNYFRQSQAIPGAVYDVLRSTAIITLETTKEELPGTLSSAVMQLLKKDFSEALFDQAKNLTKEGFSSQYKHAAFRGLLKVYEVTELHKHFTLNELIEDLENITYEDFVRCADALLTRDNLRIYLLGDMKGIDAQTLVSGMQLEQMASHPVQLSGFIYDPYLKQDAYVMNLAREDVFINALTIEFLNENSMLSTHYLITELLAETLKEKAALASVDAHDASIVLESDHLGSLKEKIQPWTEELFSEARRSLLYKYLWLLENDPRSFVSKGASMLTQGIYIDWYLNWLDKMTYQSFQTEIAQNDTKINEAQVVLQPLGGRRHG